MKYLFQLFLIKILVSYFTEEFNQFFCFVLTADSISRDHPLFNEYNDYPMLEPGKINSNPIIPYCKISVEMALFSLTVNTY
jgi:hypothetical protein